MDPLEGWNPEDIDFTGTPALIAAGIYLVMLLVFLLAYISIIRKAGYSGWWILTGIVPVLNLVMFLIFAFREWPVQRHLRSALMVASMVNAPNRDTQFTWR